MQNPSWAKVGVKNKCISLAGCETDRCFSSIGATVFATDFQFDLNS